MFQINTRGPIYDPEAVQPAQEDFVHLTAVVLLDMFFSVIVFRLSLLEHSTIE